MAGLNDILDEGQQLEVTQSEPTETHHEEQEQTTGEHEAAPPAVEQDDEADKHRKGLEATVMAERRRRQEVERQLAEIQQRQQAATQTAAPKTQGDALERPKRAQFADDEAYEDALLEYGDKRREAREQQAKQQREQQDKDAEFSNSLTTMIGRGQTKYPDFDVVVNTGLGEHLSRPQQGEALRFALAQSERGEDVAYHLGKNTAEAARVASLSPPKMLHAIGVIEAKLSVSEQSEAQDNRPAIPQTLTTQRNASGRFTPAYSGPTPLDDVLAAKR